MKEDINCNDPKAFLEYSNDMGSIYESIDECNPNKKRKTLVASGDMIVDMLSDKNLYRQSRNYLSEVRK